MIRPDLKPINIRPNIQLCKPDLDRQVVANLTTSYQIKRKVNLGSLNELSFLLPYKVSKKGKLIDNPQLKSLYTKYLIKFTYANEVEYFIVDKLKDTMESNSDYKQVDCLSLGFETSSKIIKIYKEVSKNLSAHLESILSPTIWNIGYVDALFDTKYRTLELSSTTVLDGVQQAAITFDALIEWDTINRKINFYQEKNYGQYKGHNISYGKLMQSVSQETNLDEFCTRLRVEGADGTSIQSVNSTGSDYIEDYSYFIYPFQRDVNRNVLSESRYMSNSLCHALLDYKELVKSKGAQFKSLLDTLKQQQESLTLRQNELQKINDQLATIEDALSVKNAAGEPVQDVINQKNNKLQEKNNKEAEIRTINNQITNTSNLIQQLKNVLKVENNFSSEQIKEWNPFICEKDFSNTNITNPQNLLEAATEHFYKINEPKLVVTLSLVNLYEIYPNALKLDRLRIGDIIRVNCAELKIDIEAKLVAIDFDYEGKNIGVTISNVREILSDEERFIRDMYKSISTSTSVDTSKYKWDESVSNVNDVQQILNNVWDATQREIIASNENTVTIDRRGIRVHDINNPNKQLIVQHGVLALSSDGGNTWKTAIRPEGVYAERLIGQIIAGTNLTITTQKGDFLVNSEGVKIRDLDLQVTKTDNKSRILLSANTGFRIQANKGTASSPNWIDNFYADNEGNLNITGNINATSGTFTGVINAQGGTFSGNITAYGTISGGTLKSANFEVGSISSSSISAGTITGTEINGGTITGSTLRTSAYGRRIEVDANGLRTYDGSGRNRIVINTGSDSGVSALTFYNQYGSYVGEINSYSGSNQLTLYGSNISIGSNDTSTPIGMNGAATFRGPATFYSSVDFRGSVTGLELTIGHINNLRSELDSLWNAVNARSYRGHSHSLYIGTHNHGNRDNQNWPPNGGNFTTGSD